jgi:V8-like Glu-specific endopeptidase
VFENRVPRWIFGPKRDEATGEWRRLHNEELNDLYSSPNIIRVIKWRRMRWAGHVACEKRGNTGFWKGDLREGTTWETQA